VLEVIARLVLLLEPDLQPVGNVQLRQNLSPELRFRFFEPADFLNHLAGFQAMRLWEIRQSKKPAGRKCIQGPVD